MVDLKVVAAQTAISDDKIGYRGARGVSPRSHQMGDREAHILQLALNRQLF